MIVIIRSVNSSTSKIKHLATVIKVIQKHIFTDENHPDSDVKGRIP